MPRVALLLLLLVGRAASAQDFSQVLDKADQLLEEAKKAYEAAKASNSVAGFTEAGFKLEDARIKYLALQELGSDEMRKTAGERLKVTGQLSKLIHDGRVAISGKSMEDPAKKPSDPVPPPPPPTAAPTPPPAPIPRPERAAVPDAARQRDAEKALKGLFKAEYAKKGGADHAAFAKTLLAQGDKSADEPAARWVFYKEAQDQAAQGGDLDTAYQAIDAQARAFVTDSIPAKLAVLATAGKVAKAPAEFSALTERSLRLAEEAVLLEDFDTAALAATAAGQHSRKSGDTVLAVKALPRLKEVADARARFEAFRKAREMLTRDASDSTANFEMGQFLCFVKGDWEAGLFFMAKGNDAAIKAVAEKDVTFPQEPDKQLEIADGWWDLAQKEKSALRKGRFQERSRIWYERAASQISGLAKMKVDKRLAELEDAHPGPLNLLRMVDPKADGLAGDWVLEGGQLLTPTDGAPWARLQLPYVPPAEYDVSITLKTQAPFYNLRLGLTIGDRPCMLVIGGDGGKGSGLEMIDNRSYADNNPTFVAEGGTRPAGTIVCSVRKTGVSVTLDGKKIIDWKEPARLSLYGSWQVPARGALFLATSSPRFTIEQITVTPVGPAGKRLR